VEIDAQAAGAWIDYEGSLTIAAMADGSGVRAYATANLANGERFETYVIYGPAGSAVTDGRRQRPTSARRAIASRSRRPPGSTRPRPRGTRRP